MQLCNSLHKSSLDFSKISANLKKAKTSDGLGLFQGAAYTGDPDLLTALKKIKLYEVRHFPAQFPPF